MVLDEAAARRAVAFGAVLLLHLGLVAVLLDSGSARAPLPAAVLPARLILPPPRHPPPLPSLPVPELAAAPPLAVPVPEIRLAAPVEAAPAVARAVARAGPPTSHFGAATEAGLGIDIGARAGGGAGSRGSLAAFEAAVRRQVLAGKRQPVLAWDRRNTCVVNYRVSVSRAGAIAGFTIDPCAIPEINEAARAAIRAAAPFPPPPDLGAPSYEVHGSLIFRP
jgi:protein TonB